MNPEYLDRREALNRLGLLSLVGVAGCGIGSRLGHSAAARPHLYIRRQRKEGLRSVDDTLKSIEAGSPKEIWELIKAECDGEIGQEPLTPRSSVPKRSSSHAKQNNPDFYICHAAGQRILRNALAFLLTGVDAYRATALEQIWALIDESVWPDWIDRAHLKFGLPVDLRTGMLSQDVGIGFDWLYASLSENERNRIVEGLDRRGIQPFLTSMEQDPWWANELSNWYTVIIGGLGIAGMALVGEHPKAERLVELSLEKMRDYLSIYGSDGEFNESVAYSNATRIPVNYFMAHHYHVGGGQNMIAQKPFPETGEWTIYSVLPPGRYAAFGDGWVGAEPMVSYMTAIAAASRDPVLQGFAKRYLKADSNPLLLLSFDPTVETASPEGRLPRGRAFHDNGAQIFSRTDWNPDATTMVVYGKAKRDHNHAHNDVGQLCIDALGERMIVDLGAPSAYPEDFFDESRWKYYNASTLGHNVPMFGGREQRSAEWSDGINHPTDWDKINGVIEQEHFEDQNGGYWQLDLTRAYDQVRYVKRTVVHLFPGFVAVLDEGELEREESISLRWHTIAEARVSPMGAFSFESNGVGLIGRIEILDGELDSHQIRRHSYEAPYHRDRTGDLLEQRREPYIESALNGSRYRALTLFALADEESGDRQWTRDQNSWSFETADDRCEVSLIGDSIKISSTLRSRGFEVQI